MNPCLHDLHNGNDGFDVPGHRCQSEAMGVVGWVLLSCLFSSGAMGQICRFARRLMLG
jgi:hypothetical protein